MTQSNEELTVAQRLGRLLGQGLLPVGGPAEAAERLIERLERPARVALLGLPGAGKSAILNLLTGTVVVPESLRLPTIIVQYGTEERILCTLADGKTQVVPGRDLSDVLVLSPALVTLELDLPALKVISLMEVSAGPMEAEQRRAAVWASKRADILIWCTTSYLPEEQAVWEGMPDVVKDNGFLFLTKFDLLGSREAAKDMLERVETLAGEEFREVLAVSAQLARGAILPGGQMDRQLFRESGAAAMITAIKNRVQMARRADTDTAELLLARHEAGKIVSRRLSENGMPAPGPVQWQPPAEPKPSAAPESGDPQAAVPIPEPITEPTSVRVPQSKPEVPIVEPAPVEMPEPQPEEAKPDLSEAEDENGGEDDALSALLARTPRARDPLDRLTSIQRPMPSDSTAPEERTVRASLFGMRKPAAPVSPPPAVRSARPGEPITRVRAPAPPPTEPQRPAAPAPEELATPRIAAPRDRRAEPETAEPEPIRGNERRERPRIAARVLGQSPATPVTTADQDMVQAAVRLIASRATGLIEVIDPAAKVPVDMILDHCRETTERVIDLLSRSRVPDVRRITDDLGEVQDLIMLMQLEKGHAPADDALTLLLQIRRDLETLLAA